MPNALETKQSEMTGCYINCCCGRWRRNSKCENEIFQDQALVQNLKKWVNSYKDCIIKNFIKKLVISWSAIFHDGKRSKGECTNFIRAIITDDSSGLTWVVVKRTEGMPTVYIGHKWKWIYFFNFSKHFKKHSHKDIFGLQSRGTRIEFV